MEKMWSASSSWRMRSARASISSRICLRWKNQFQIQRHHCPLPLLRCSSTRLAPRMSNATILPMTLASLAMRITSGMMSLPVNSSLNLGSCDTNSLAMMMVPTVGLPISHFFPPISMVSVADWRMASAACFSMVFMIIFVFSRFSRCSRFSRFSRFPRFSRCSRWTRF